MIFLKKFCKESSLEKINQRSLKHQRINTAYQRFSLWPCTCNHWIWETMNIFLLVGGENVTSRQSGKVAFPNSVRSGSSRQSFLSGMCFASRSRLQCWIFSADCIKGRNVMLPQKVWLKYACMSLIIRLNNPSPTLYTSP